MAAVSGVDEAMTGADVGTGTGFAAAGIAPRVRRVLAVDNSPAMLEVARKNLSELGVINVELQEGDVRALPLESGSVDAAFANMVLHDAEDPGSMLREMARVVRPSGDCGRVRAPLCVDARGDADVWLGFEEGQVAEYFQEAGLPSYGYESLGMQ